MQTNLRGRMEVTAAQLYPVGDSGIYQVIAKNGCGYRYRCRSYYKENLQLRTNAAQRIHTQF